MFQLITAAVYLFQRTYSLAHFNALMDIKAFRTGCHQKSYGQKIWDLLILTI